MADNSTSRLLRRRTVEEMTGLRRAAIYKRMADGTFPRTVKLDGRAVAWVEAEVAAWVADRIAARDGR